MPGSLADDPALNILQVKPVVDTLFAAQLMLPMAPAVEVETKLHTTTGVDENAGENVTALSTYEFAETEVDDIVPFLILSEPIIVPAVHLDRLEVVPL